MMATTRDRSMPTGTTRLIPHLNTRSPFLVHLYNMSSRVNGRWLKSVVERDVGKVVLLFLTLFHYGRYHLREIQVIFIETFEAWLGRRIGSVIFEFADAVTLERFLAMPQEWIHRVFNGIPTAREIMVSLA
jgi:hypothetical protein